MRAKKKAKRLCLPHEVFYCIEGLPYRCTRELVEHMKMTIVKIILKDRSISGRPADERKKNLEDSEEPVQGISGFCPPGFDTPKRAKNELILDCSDDN